MHRLVLILAAGVTTLPSHAQDAANDDCLVSKVGNSAAETCLSANDFAGELDLTVPSNSLFALMGAAPDNVIRPTPGEKITASFLPDLADALGNKQQGFAVEIRPSLFMTPDRYAYGELLGTEQPLEGSAARVAKLQSAKKWAPLTAHFAVSRGDGATQPSRAGFGVNYTKDSADPMFSSAYGNCLANDVAELDRQAAARAQALTAADPNLDLQKALETAYAELGVRVGRLADACVRKSSPWNRSIFGLGVAVYRSAPEGSTEESENGVGVWFSKSFQLGTHGQLIAHARYNDNLLKENEVAGVKTLQSIDSTSLAARYTRSVTGDEPGDALSADVIRAIVEIGAFEEKIEGQPKDDYVQYGLGAEFRVRQNLYFQILFGDTTGSTQERDVFFNGQLKWSFSSSRAQ